VNALETPGAWGWAIRQRSSSRLLLDAFLSYAPGDVTAFYKTVSSHTGELAQLLRLPATQVITDEFRRAGVPHGKLVAEFSRVESNLGQAAEHYFDHQALFVTNYKKAKHGAPIIRGSKLAQQEFYVLAPDLSASDTNSRSSTRSPTQSQLRGPNEAGLGNHSGPGQLRPQPQDSGPSLKSNGHEWALRGSCRASGAV
jgi:hypothetical protein